MTAFSRKEYETQYYISTELPKDKWELLKRFDKTADNYGISDHGTMTANGEVYECIINNDCADIMVYWHRNELTINRNYVEWLCEAYNYFHEEEKTEEMYMISQLMNELYNKPIKESDTVGG